MSIPTSTDTALLSSGTPQAFAAVLSKIAGEPGGTKWMLDELVYLAENTKSPSEQKLIGRVVSQFLSGKGSAADFTLASQLLALNTDQNSSAQQTAVTDAAIELMGGGAPVLTPTSPTAPAATRTGPSAAQISKSGATSLQISGTTINTGRYIITFSNHYDNTINSNGSDGQVSIYDTVTKTWVDVCGDPHVVTSGGEIAHFDQNGLQIDLADGTVVQIKPGPMQNGVAWISDVAVSKNGQTVGATGMNGGKVALTGILNESAGAYDPYFASASEAVLITSSTGGLDQLSVLGANGELTALNCNNMDLDSDASVNSVLMQQLETLITSGITPELQASLQNIFNTLLDKAG